MNDLVSVIVPVYKVEKYLDRCVDSIINQTYRNLEIILVDDGSPDNCPQMCDAWTQRDNRIKVIHKKNAGLGMARNSGLEIATGNYLMFVDSDDYLSENAVEVLYARMIQDKTDMAIGKHSDVYEDGTTNDSFCCWMEDKVISKDILLSRMGEDRRYAVVAWAKMYRQSIFSDIRYATWKCGEDCYILPDILERCRRISIVNELVYYYYQRSDSILHQLTEERLLDDITANLKLARYLWKQGHEKAGRKWFVNGVNKASLLAEPKQVLKVFSEFFSEKEKRKLLKGTEAKTRVKWACLYSTWLLKVVRTMRSLKRRMHG